MNNNESELKHYGVLGMKWGEHRARARGEEYEYKSLRQKRLAKKLAKARIKGNAKRVSKYNRKLEVIKERDKSRQDYAKTQTVGKAVVRRLLMGFTGANAYERSRASGSSRGASIARGLLSRYNAPLRAIGRLKETNKAKKRVEQRQRDR